jgi:Laminin G domain.
MGKRSAVALNDGQWHHFAVTYYTNPASEDISLYIDGVEQATLDGDLRATRNYGTNTAKTVIGARNADSVPALFFNGQIDEIMLYNRALNLTEIQAVYNATR